MSRSSTSSSSRRALLLCLGILLLLEFGAARRDWLWRLDPRRPVGIFLAVEDELIAPAEDARVVIVGSSVMRDALIPSAFESAAALPPGSVLNTSLPNATPFDFVTLYERNRRKLGGARLLIIGVEDWYFYEEPGISERYHRWATLSDRFTDYSGTTRLPLLVSWVWKTYAARQAFAIDGLRAAIMGDRADVVGDDRRVKWRPAEQAAGPDSFDLGPYEARLRTREWRDRQVRHLREIVRLSADDGLATALVRMPIRAEALRLRSRVDPDAEERLRNALSQVREGQGRSALLDFPTGTEVGLQERNFLDERHLGTEGAEIFSRYLGSWATAHYDLR